MVKFDDAGRCEEFDEAGRALVAPAPSARQRYHADWGASLGSVSAGDALAAVVGGLEKRSSGSGELMRMLKLWQHLGDARLRSHVASLYVRQNRATRELVAYVDASVWLHEFTMNAPGTLAEWNVLCMRHGSPELRVQKLTFRIARARAETAPSAPSDASFDPARPAAVPLTAQECAQIEEKVAVIEDETLRARARDAMKSTKSWQKAKKVRKTP